MRLPLAAAAAVAVVSSSLHAAFTFTFVANPVSVGTFAVPTGGSSPTPAPVTGTRLYAVDIYALNTGGDTGTGISALNVSGTATNPFIWLTGPTGSPNETNYNGSATFLRNGQDRSYVTLAESTTSDETFLDERYTRANVTPTNFGNLGAGGARTGAIGTFSIAGLADPIVQADATVNGGKGLLVAHMVLPAGTALATVSAAGSSGSAVSETRSLLIVTDPGPLVVAPTPPTTVTFGPVVTNGAPFSVTINASGGPTDILSLAVGAVPAGISNIIVTGGGPLPASFTVTGLVDYSLNKTTAIIPFTVSSSLGGSVASSFALVVIPEPTLFAGVGLGGWLLRRRCAAKVIG